MLEKAIPGWGATEEDGFEALKFRAMNQFLELGGDEGEIEPFELDVGKIAVFKLFPVPDNELALGKMRSKVLHESADMVEREDAEAVHSLGLEVMLGSLNRVAERIEDMGSEFWLVCGAAGGNVYCDLGVDLRGWAGYRNLRYASLRGVGIA